MRKALLILALALPAAAEKTPLAWLDGALTNWNKAGMALPQAPAATEAPGARCGGSLRAASGKEDKALIAAGWSPIGAMQVFGKARVMLASSGVDGMCRPDGLQGFVFVDGRFAGTLAPQPTRARSDGTLSQLRLLAEDGVLAEFARYLDEDPLCCPSRTTNVRFRIDATPEGALLVPVEASSTPR
jgi:hypothetical protein